MLRNRVLISASIVAVAIAFSGCKKKKSETPPEDQQVVDNSGAETTAAATTAGETGAATTAPAAGAKGTVTGSVKFTGDAPKLDPIKPDKDPTVCGASIDNDTVVVNANKTLKNTVVRVVSSDKVAGPTTPVVLNQKGCRYLPRVAVAVLGQPVEAHSEDTTIMHNVHSYKGEGDAQTGLDNISQPPGSGPATLQAPDEAGPLLVKCDVHPWMTSTVYFANNPYIAVTGDDGSFKIENVPAGKYKLEAWHEYYGKKEIDVEIKAEAPAAGDFEFKPEDHK